MEARGIHWRSRTPFKRMPHRETAACPERDATTQAQLFHVNNHHLLNGSSPGGGGVAGLAKPGIFPSIKFLRRVTLGNSEGKDWRSRRVASHPFCGSLAVNNASPETVVFMARAKDKTEEPKTSRRQRKAPQLSATVTYCTCYFPGVGASVNKHLPRRDVLAYKKTGCLCSFLSESLGTRPTNPQSPGLCRPCT